MKGSGMTIVCGSFVVDDFSFSAPPLKGSINGVSAPVDTSFKETPNTRTWEAATVQLIAQELANKYGLQLVYDCMKGHTDQQDGTEQPDGQRFPESPL